MRQSYRRRNKADAGKSHYVTDLVIDIGQRALTRSRRRQHTTKADAPALSTCNVFYEKQHAAVAKRKAPHCCPTRVTKKENL
jgi:hypothetical protein